MRAIILAAGRGTRLGPATIDRPKCLFEVGGRSLLHHSLVKLEQAGISETIVVVGHAAEPLLEALGGQLGAMRTLSIATPDYEKRGSLGSLLTAVEQTGTSPTLLLESDLLYHPEFLTEALCNSTSTLLTAEISGSGDEVYVCADSGGQLSYLHKAPSPERRAQALGEFAGISLLLEVTLIAFAATARRWLTENRLDPHYEEVLLDLADVGHPIAVKHCPGLPWTEVDNYADLIRARERIWPELRGCGHFTILAQAPSPGSTPRRRGGPWPAPYKQRATRTG
jgi:choline kinase